MDADVSGGGTSRRRVLAGALWAAPVIVLATSAPARAASLPLGGIQFLGLNAFSVLNFWDQTTQQNLTVVVLNANLQNIPDPPGGSVPSVVEFTQTFVANVGAIAAPRWGLGSNSEGISNPAWTLVSGPTVSAGVATIVVRYAGTPLGPWATIQPTVWIETLGSQAGQSSSSTVVAIHDEGSTSTDALAATIVAGSIETIPLVDTDDVDWVYFPAPVTP